MRIKISLTILVIISAFLISPGLAQRSSKEIEEIINGLESSKFPDQKYNYVERLFQIINGDSWEKIEESQRERIRLLFIPTLKQGLNVWEKGEAPYVSKYLEYLGKIAGKLKDLHIIPILIEGLSCAYFEDALTEIGEPTIEPLLKILEKGTGHQRSGTLRVFIKLIKKKKIGKKNSEKIKQATINMSKDKLYEVKYNAIRLLYKLGDEESIFIIKKMAKKDPYTYKIDASLRGGKKGDKIKIYPVREEAEKILKQLEEKKKTGVIKK